MPLGMSNSWSVGMSEHLQAAHHAQEAAVAVAKVTPPVAATGMTLAGYPLAEWLILVTILYSIADCSFSP